MCHEAHVGYVLVAEAKPCSAADGLGESGIHTILKTAKMKHAHYVSEYQPRPNMLDAGWLTFVQDQGKDDGQWTS